MIFIKIIAIWYIIIFTGNYLSSNTGAYFTSTSDVMGYIQAGTWAKETPDSDSEDNPLSFIVKDQTIKSCSSTNINVDVSNSGEDMKDGSSYEVYYTDDGDPKDGAKVGEGSISVLASNGSESLSYSAEKPGNYKFKADTEQGEVWSEMISVVCDNQSNDSDKKTEEDSDQNADSPQTEPSSQTTTENKQSDQENTKSEDNQNSDGKDGPSKETTAPQAVDNNGNQINEGTQNTNKDGGNE
ncbi:amyloid fiber anchoring/assembly protein TapA [Bacillus sp. FJAT-49736]|nr:amyloid fiber anchoring/assembly protein TapA [Bacillus sp. FJAT-49736]